MKIVFSQIYIEPEVNFPFSLSFTRLLSREFSARLTASNAFNTKFGPEFMLIFRVSAKKGLEENDLCGPTVYKRDKDVEFSIFLPFDVIQKCPDPIWGAAEFILNGAYLILQRYEIDITELKKAEASILEALRTNPDMIRSPRN